MNHYYYNPLGHSESLSLSQSQLRSQSRYSPPRSSLNEVFALLEQQQQQQNDRQLTQNGNSNITANTGSATLPPNTLNSNDTSSNNNNNNNNSNNNDQATNVLVNILALAWLFVFMWFCCRSRPPGPEHWRGAEIRRRYLERVAREQAKKDRKLQSPEYRRRLVQHNMHTRTVISKDEEGNWTLGPVNYPCQDLANVSATTASTVGDIDDDDDEQDNENEYSCVICLDPFHVGDVVSWSRFSEDCHHVYHADCIQPWLEGKRQDECPSCRSRLILHQPPGFPTTDTDGTTDTSDDTDNGTADANTNANSNANADGGDIETGTNSNATHGQQQQHQQQLEEDDELDKDEEDSFFVIMHGLISRVAKRASYTLIGTKDSMDERDNRSLIPPASPFRRVVSYEPMRSSPTTTVMNRSRPNSFARSTSPTSMSFLQTIPAIQSCASEESITTTCEDGGQALSEHVPFRRVQSDIVGSNLLRQQRQQQQQYQVTSSIGVNTTISNMRLSAERTLASSSASSNNNDDGDDDNDHRDTILHPSLPPTTDTDNHESSLNRTTADCPNVCEQDVRVAETMETHEAASTLPTTTTSMHTTTTSNDVTTQTEEDER